jgi:hypothetical protein
MMGRRWLLLTVQVLSALCAIGAAGLWFAASIDSTPERVLDAMRARGGMDIFGSDMNELVQSLAWQGTMNARAAGAAGLSALFQALGVAITISKGRAR